MPSIDIQLLTTDADVSEVMAFSAPVSAFRAIWQSFGTPFKASSLPVRAFSTSTESTSVDAVVIGAGVLPLGQLPFTSHR